MVVSIKKKIKFTIPVCVGPRADGFHDGFALDESIAYQFGQNTSEYF